MIGANPSEKCYPANLNVDRRGLNRLYTTLKQLKFLFYIIDWYDNTYVSIRAQDKIEFVLKL